jgi:hypothetical protein
MILGDGSGTRSLETFLHRPNPSPPRRAVPEEAKQERNFLTDTSESERDMEMIDLDEHASPYAASTSYGKVSKTNLWVSLRRLERFERL